MSIKTIEELMNSVRSQVGDSTDDQALSLIEDVQDTLVSLSAQNSENWKQKYEVNDKQWREKYKSRFFNSPEKPDVEIIETNEEDVKEKPLTFDNLFTVKE